MTDKVRNILRGAGSIISVSGAASVRTSKSIQRGASADHGGLAGDFQRIGNDLKHGLDQVDSEKLAHG